MKESAYNQIEHFNNNYIAIKCLKNIECDKRNPTSSEIELLKKYNGWGSIFNAFPNSDNLFISNSWHERNANLKSILTENEYKQISESITDAFFTPEYITSAIWNIVERLGYKQGIVLEPSCGTGNFIYNLNKESNFRFVGVEKDSISARICKLVNIKHSYIFECGFEKIPLQQECFDLVIGNPPFGNYSINLCDYYEYNKYSIHNQFILKSLRALKHNKHAVFVVSRYVLDSTESNARKEISKIADLVGAYRLPAGAFKDAETSNTEVITDILVFKRKCANDENFSILNYGTKFINFPDWVDTSVFKSFNNQDIHINNYFIKNPSHIAGVLSTKSSSFGQVLDVVCNDNITELLDHWTVANIPEITYDDKEDETQIQSEFDALVAHLYIEISGKEIGVVDRNESGDLYRVIEQDIGSTFRYKIQILSDETIWSEKYKLHVSGNYYEKVPLRDVLGNKCYETNEKGYSTGRIIYENKFISSDKINSRSKLGKLRFEKLNLLIDLRDCLTLQLTMEANDSSAEQLEHNRSILNTLYSDFKNKFGYINAHSNSSLIDELPDAGLLLALENDYKKPVKEFLGYNSKGKQSFKTIKSEAANKAAIFDQRVVFKNIRPTKADNPDHALSLSLSYRGCVDIAYMANLLDSNNDKVISLLHKETPTPQIFFDHELSQWVHKSIFLSGNVRKKLLAAERLGDEIARHALQAVQPPKITIDNISITLGMTWLPLALYNAFVCHITDDSKATIQYEQITNIYDLASTPSTAKLALYSTESLDLLKILDHLFVSRQ